MNALLEEVIKLMGEDTITAAEIRARLNRNGWDVKRYDDLAAGNKSPTSTLSWWTNEELGKLRCMFERLALSTEIAAALCQEGTALGSRWHDRHLRANVRRKYTTNFAPAPCRRSLKIGAVRFLD
jgi:hypothetical protein